MAGSTKTIQHSASVCSSLSVEWTTANRHPDSARSQWLQALTVLPIDLKRSSTQKWNFHFKDS
ncbi:hypothetical protein AB205_0153890 [Aquarana catesbeiana]|uniref:Uncharacterized protein n=1 Tax=Aquarana catesbeiana TaxID=8400 RepID=A0A2G9RQK6_AQUCT|nr:hypothetical protein AB205_0153890 [Aquarana catesbeiana]